MSPRPEVVVDGLRFPEGPVWSTDGTVVCTSVAEGALYRVWPSEGRKERIADVGGGANAAAAAEDGGFLVTQNGGIDFSALGLYEDPPPYRPATPGVQRVGGDGSVSYLLNDGFLAPNDLVVAADGTLYFTDPPHHPPPPEPMGRVHAYRSGQLRTLAAGFGYCNGIALDPGGTVVVVEGNGLMRVEEDGSKEWVCQLPGAAGDGFCFDLDGNFYVAAAADHGILIVDPRGIVDRVPPDRGRQRGDRHKLLLWRRGWSNVVCDGRHSGAARRLGRASRTWSRDLSMADCRGVTLKIDTSRHPTPGGPRRGKAVPVFTPPRWHL